MKKIYLGACLLLTLTSVSRAELVPSNLWDENHGQDAMYVIQSMFTFPQAISYNFDEHIQVVDGAKAYIMEGEAVLREGDIVVENFTSSSGESSVLSVDIEWNLPLGKEYTYVIPTGSVCSPNDPANVNIELKINFFIPQYLDTRGIEYEDYGKNPKLWLWYWVETEPFSTPQAFLYEGDELMATLPMDVSWDSDLGQVSVPLGNLNTKPNVKYTLHIPAQSYYYRITWPTAEPLANDDLWFAFLGTEEGGLKYQEKISGIENIGVEEPDVKVLPGGVSVAGGTAPVEVYNTSGQLLFAKPGDAHIALPPGIYLIRTGDGVKRVAVR